MTGFPCVMFCVEHDTHIDGWRVLHARRVLQSILAAPDE